MNDSEYIFDVNKQIKCQYVNYHRECLDPAFLSKNMGLKKWCVTKVAHCIFCFYGSFDLEFLLDKTNEISTTFSWQIALFNTPTVYCDAPV